jgi:hypothetical protein
VERWLVACCVVALGCGAPSPVPPTLSSPRDNLPAPPNLPSPARFALAEGANGLLFEADPAPGPADLLALGPGVRLRLRAGLVVEQRPDPRVYRGFLSLPPRLGGGVLFWSETRVFHGPSFFAPAEVLVDAESIGEARPFLDAVLISTNAGFLRWQPGSDSVRPFDGPTLAAAASIDARRGLLLDVFGRARVTEDGGQSYRDLLDKDGFVAGSLEITREALVLHQATGGGDVRLDGEGLSRPDVGLASGALGLLGLGDVRRGLFGLSSFSGYSPPRAPEMPTFVERLGEGRAARLAPSTLPSALPHAALTPNGLGLALLDGRLRVFSPQTGRSLADMGIVDASAAMLGCEPTRVGDDVLLACVHRGGAHVLRVGLDLSTRLEASFPRPGRFVQGLGARFGFEGPCGSQPPSARDFSYLEPSDEESAEEDPFAAAPYALGGSPELPETSGLQGLGDADVARFCQRLPDGHWTPRELRGPGVKGLYLWLPGDRGAATAVLLGGPTAAAVTASEGVRRLSIDPADPRLAGGQLPAPLSPEPSGARATIERSFWLGPDGRTLHGWLATEPVDPSDAPPEELVRKEYAEDSEADEGAWSGGGVLVDGSPARLLPVSAPRGRPAALRVAADGALTVRPAPEEAESFLVRGALALAWSRAGEVWESVDGGQSFQETSSFPVAPEGAPIWSSEAAACSELGCSLGGGLVRLGWGGAPRAPKDERLVPAEDDFSTARPAAPAVGLRCSALSEPPEPPADSETPIALGAPTGDRLGRLRAGRLTATLFAPFRAGARGVSKTLAQDVTDGPRGLVVPVLPLPGKTETELGLLLVGETRGVDFSPPNPRVLALEGLGHATGALALSSGNLAVVDGGQNLVWLVGVDSPRALVPLARIPSFVPQRLFPGRGEGGAPLIVGVAVASGELFAMDLDLGRAVLGPARSLGTLHALGATGEGPCKGALPLARFAVEVPVELALKGHILDEGGITYAWLDLEATRDGLCARGLEAPLADLGMAGSSLVITFGKEPRSVVRRGLAEAPATCRLHTSRE